MTRRLLPLLFLAGCSPTPKPPEVPPTLAVVVPTPAEPKPEPPPPPPPKSTAEPFRFPADQAGKQIERALFPIPATPTVSGVSGPKPRSSELTRGELPAVQSMPTLSPAGLLPRRRVTPPSAPAEAMPGDLGLVADLSGYRLPESKPARVASQPPPTAVDVPPSARQWTERASTEDPCAELSAERIVRTLMLPPSLAGPLLKLMVPDPFELAEQVRPPAGPELGTTPAEVPRP